MSTPTLAIGTVVEAVEVNDEFMGNMLGMPVGTDALVIDHFAGYGGPLGDNDRSHELYSGHPIERETGERPEGVPEDLQVCVSLDVAAQRKHPENDAFVVSYDRTQGVVPEDQVLAYIAAHPVSDDETELTASLEDLFNSSPDDLDEVDPEISDEVDNISDFLEAIFGGVEPDNEE